MPTLALPIDSGETIVGKLRRARERWWRLVRSLLRRRGTTILLLVLVLVRMRVGR